MDAGRSPPGPGGACALSSAATPPPPPVHPQLQTLRDGFLNAHGEARRVAGGLDEAAFNRPPAPGAWSVGQCLGHLVTVGAPLADRLEAALADARARGLTGAPPYRLGLVGGYFARALAPNRGPMRAPSAYAPAEHYDLAATLGTFEALQERLARIVETSEGVALARVRVASPAAPLLRLNAAAWLTATLAHERRHLAQAARARAEVS